MAGEPRVVMEGGRESGPFVVYGMTRIAPTVAHALGVPCPGGCQEEPIGPILDDLRGAERIALLAPDALGLVPWKRHRAQMPYLAGLHKERSLLLRAVMPTITPVNFATMVTGVPPSVHGVGAFTDDLACESLFDGLRAQGRKSAGVGRRGYTGCELMGRLADVCGCAEERTDAGVERLALEIAEAERPDFLIVQLGSTDDAFHRYGPSSPAAGPVVKETDSRLRRMASRLGGLRYAVLIHGDHGQHDTESGGSHGSDSDEDSLVPCTWLPAPTRADPEPDEKEVVA